MYPRGVSILTIIGLLLVSDLGGKLARSYSHQLLLTKVRRADKNLINENHAIEILLQTNENPLVICSLNSYIIKCI